MDKVKALIIGAQKAGTTSLYRYMMQHPEIVFSQVKEITYFVDDDLYAKGQEYYHSFFPAVDSDSFIVSSYVHMLASQNAPERVYDYNPDMKLIVLLREPVERAWSAYQYARQMGWEDRGVSFIDALRHEDQRLKSSDPRISRDMVYGYSGLYCRHLSHWMSVFPDKQLLILKADELKYNQSNCLDRVWQFLGISHVDNIDTSKEYNKAGRSRSQFLNYLVYDKRASLPRFIGRLLPPRIRVWVRSNVFPLLKRINTVERVSSPVPDKAGMLLRDYYSEDLKELEENFHVKF